MKFTFKLTILIILYVVGVLIYTRGFLLRRIVIESISSYDKNSPMEAHFRRAVIIVIDALRYDFVDFNHSDNFTGLSYQNKLRKIATILKNEPQNSRLYRFLADPPTTTLQRLKGLTTGSLPTFVDAGANFAKTAIFEDNFIDQLRSKNKSIYFMGDDTWTGLYPHQFAKSFPYPSFNVKDLDTVDAGVISHLVPELANREWDLLIGHMLGVDHCGHTYGPNHPIMSDKLQQMDDFIETVIKNLDDDTILFVMGDHGMTKTGDHGGDSSEEIEAALLVYSKKKLGLMQSKEEATVSQIDFVASISLLLGLPIPYQNLGVVIPDLFKFCWKDVCTDSEKELTFLQALHVNAKQVHKYFKDYANITDEFDADVVDTLDATFNRAVAEYDKILDQNRGPVIDESLLISTQSEYQQYLMSVRSLLKKKWAQFDMHAMFFGITIFTTALLINVYSTFSENLFNFSKSSLAIVTCFVASFLLLFSNWFLSFLIFLLGFIFIILFKVCRGSVSFKNSLSTRDIFAVVIWFVYVTSLMSNSFVVNEGSVTSFLLQSCLYIQFFFICHDYSSLYYANWIKNSKKTTLDSKSTIRGSVFILMFLSLAASFSVGLSRTFQTCREEQTNCTESSFLQPSLPSNDELSTAHSKNQLLLAIVAVIAIFFFTYQWLRRNGNANGWSPAVVSFKYVTFFSVLLLVIYWCLRTNTRSSLKQLSLLAFPVAKSIYLSVFVSVVTILWRPLCTFVVKHVPPTVKENLNSVILNNILLGGASPDVVPRIFHQLRANWMKERSAVQQQQPEEDDEPKIYVYGLATIFSSPLLALLLAVVVLLAMLLDVVVAPSMFLLCAVFFIILEFHSLSVRLESRVSIDNVPTSGIILFLLLSCERFYSFGHHPTITSIRWEAAYHGFEGDFHHNFIPATLILLNTFASQVVATLALPLLVYWPFTRSQSSSKHGRSNNSMENGSSSPSVNGLDSVKGEFLICEDDKKHVMFQLCLRTLLFCALKMFAMMICVTLHRRHLMVWKIFAPRFIYETVAFFVVSVICMFNYLFFLRTFSVANKFVSNLK